MLNEREFKPATRGMAAEGQGRLQKCSPPRWITAVMMLLLGSVFAIKGSVVANDVNPLIKQLQSADPQVRIGAVRALSLNPEPGATGALISLFEKGDPLLSQEVAWALKRLGPAALPSLLKATESANREVRFWSAYSLGKIGSPEAVGTLTKMLSESDPALRANATRALGEIADPSTFPTLIQQLRDESQEVRLSASWALSRIGQLAVPGLLALLQQGEESLQPLVAITLKRIPSQQAQDAASNFATGLIAQIQTGEAQARLAAVQALSELREPRAASALAQALRDQEESVRAAAEIALERLRGEAVPFLINLLQSQEPSAQIYAAVILGRIADPKVLPALVSVLGSSDPRVRAAAAEALGRLGNNKATAPLIPLLKDTNQDIAANAATALGLIGDSKAIPALAEALPDAPAQVAESIAWALARMGDGDIEPNLAIYIQPFVQQLGAGPDEQRTAALSALRKVGKYAIPALTGLLVSDSVEVRLWATTALGNTGSEQALEPLQKAMKDAEATVRANAALSLAQIPGEAALAALVAALKEESEEVRASAAEALGLREEESARQALLAYEETLMKRLRAGSSLAIRIEAVQLLGRLRSQRAIPSLAQALGEEESLSREACWALARIGEAAIPSLLDLLREGGEQQKRWTAIALGNIGGAMGSAALAPALRSDDPEVRAACLWALAQMDGKAGEILSQQVGQLIESLAGGSGQLHDAAVLDLVNLSGLALPRLVSALSAADPALRREAAFVLGRIGDPAAREALQRALADLADDVREAAEVALRKVGE